MLGHARRFAREFGVPLDESGLNLGLDQLVNDLRDGAGPGTLIPLALPVPAGAPARLVPVTDPVPLYAQSMTWRREEPDPVLTGLRRALTERRDAEGRLDWDPGRHWFPGPDVAWLHP